MLPPGRRAAGASTSEAAGAWRPSRADPGTSEAFRIRIRDLAAAAQGDLARLPHRDAEVEELRKERDQDLAAVRRCEADLAAQRDIAQRLMADNTRLLDSVGLVAA
ncbi:hypothetical protein ACFRCI_50245 [Streptomyces sp. NPDC056638]|uniref:hypothetical protein n=1 Tax=Streptomyces sp. NPDC056638 TaxID=3345887 RepID=UPI0036ACE2A0